MNSVRHEIDRVVLPRKTIKEVVRVLLHTVLIMRSFGSTSVERDAPDCGIVYKCCGHPDIDRVVESAAHQLYSALVLDGALGCTLTFYSINTVSGIFRKKKEVPWETWVFPFSVVDHNIKPSITDIIQQIQSRSAIISHIPQISARNSPIPFTFDVTSFGVVQVSRMYLMDFFPYSFSSLF